MPDQEIPNQQTENEANNPLPPTSSNKKLIILLVALAIIGFSSTTALLGYMYAAKTLPTAQNVDTLQTDKTDQPQVLETTTNTSPSPKPTLSPNNYGNTYNSESLGLGFYYASTMLGSNERIQVTAAGDTVYVHAQNQPKESGQSVKRFTKDPNISFEAAIKNQFLNNIAESTCFIETKAGEKQGTTIAEINYPVPANAEEPFFAYGEECPANYKRTNGIRYFYYDATVPDAFFFFSIGQYGIPAYSNDSETLWQDTFQAY